MREMPSLAEQMKNLALLYSKDGHYTPKQHSVMESERFKDKSNTNPKGNDKTSEDKR